MLVPINHVVPSGTGLSCEHGSSWAFLVEKTSWESDGRVLYHWHYKCGAETDGVRCGARSGDFTKELCPKRSVDATPTPRVVCECDKH